MYNRLAGCWHSCEYARTCQSDDVQCGAIHIKGDVQVDNIRVVPVQLGKPDTSHFGGLLVEDWSEGLELCLSKGWILWENSE